MKQLLRDIFLPLDYVEFLFHKYQRCSQDFQTMHEYIAEFLHLAERNDLHETGEHIARYVEGLKPAIRDIIGFQMLLNATNVRNMALTAQLLMQDTTNTRFDYQRRVHTTQPRITCIEKGKLSQTNNQSKLAIADSCYDKNKPQEISNKDNQKRDNPHAKPPPIKCYRYNQEGHKSNICPQRMLVDIVEYKDEECRENTKLYSKECYEDDDEGEYEDDDSQAYVVRQLLLTPKVDDETQHKLFLYHMHTKPTDF